jgi:hypothetical protein
MMCFEQRAGKLRATIQIPCRTTKCEGRKERLVDIKIRKEHSSMSHYTEEEQARLVALPTAILMAALVMSEAEPMKTLLDVIDQLDFVQEVKQAYPDNLLIQGTFADTENSQRVLHLSSFSDKEAVWHELRLYIEEVGALLGVDTEASEFRAFLATLVKKLAKDVGKGLFGNDPLIVKDLREYLKTLEQQFSLYYDLANEREKYTGGGKTSI